MSGDNLRVSVIIPVYNREGLIKATLSSILAQTHPADEIIVVDDGSTDKSAEIAESFGPNIHVIRAENGGPARARNKGFAASTGDLILFFDSDDLATSNYIGSRYDAIMEGADIAYGPWLRFWEVDGVLEHDELVRQTREIEDSVAAFLDNWVLFVPNCLIRRHVFEQAGGYPEDFFTGEDMLLMWNMLRQGVRLTHTNNSLLLVRQHQASQASTAIELTSQRLIDELNLVNKILQSTNMMRDYSGSLSALRSRRTRAYGAVKRAGLLVPSGEINFGKAPTVLDNLLMNIGEIIARVRTFLRFKRYGHRIPAIYSASSFDLRHSEIVKTLGYELCIRDSISAQNSGAG